MRRLLAITALFGALQLVGATVAYGQGRPCVPYEAAAQRLAEKYQEAPVQRGITAGGNMVEIFAAEDGATWTAMIVSPDGTACLTASGTDWTGVAAPVAPAGTEM